MYPPGSTRDDAACILLRSCGGSVLWNLRVRAVRPTLPNARLISGALNWRNTLRWPVGGFHTCKF